MFVLCSEHAEQASSRSVLGGGGGGNRLAKWRRGEQQASCLVAKQAVEFPQVYTMVIVSMMLFP